MLVGQVVDITSCQIFPSWMTRAVTFLIKKENRAPKILEIYMELKNLRKMCL